jgi:hypothetical protein
MSKVRRGSVPEADETPQADPPTATDPFGEFGREMSELLRSAHEAGETERTRAREEAEAIVAEAEAEATRVRDTARAEAAAQISAAAAIREGAERAVSEAEARTDQLRAALEVEQSRVTEKVTTERDDARSAIEDVIRGLQEALHRLDASTTTIAVVPAQGDAVDLSAAIVESPESPESPESAQSSEQPALGGDEATDVPGSPSEGEGKSDGDAPTEPDALTSAVRAAITMAFGPKADSSN